MSDHRTGVGCRRSRYGHRPPLFVVSLPSVAVRERLLVKLRRLAPLLATPLVAATLVVASSSPAQAATFPNPAWTAATGDIHLSSPTVADVNGDGVKDVVVGSLDRRVHALDGRTGAEFRGWPVAVPGGVESSPTVADIDGFGQPTIIVGYGSLNDQPAPGGVIALKTDGGVRWNRPSMDVFNEWTGGGADGVPEAVETTPAVADLNGDGSP